MFNLNAIVSQQIAQKLADDGYVRETPMIWDRYNPRYQAGGKPTDPEIAWRLMPSRSNYDTTCCLAAPTVKQALWPLFKIWLERQWDVPAIS